MGVWDSKVAPPPFSGAGVLITGAGTGIGAHACVQLAKAGWAVVASVFTEEQSHALRERTRLYKAVHVVMLDVTSTRSIEQVKSYIVTEAIPLVALVNNAAIVYAGALEHMPLSKIEDMFRVITLGSVAMTQTMLPVIRHTLPACQKAGFHPKIVNISSGAAIFGQPMHGPYTIAKTALEGFSDVLRRELRPQGIQVVVVQPSAIKTEAYAHWEGALNALWKREADELYGETKRQIVTLTRLAHNRAHEPLAAGKKIAHVVAAASSWGRVKIGMELWFLNFLQMLPVFLSDPFWEFVLRLVVRFAKR